MVLTLTQVVESFIIAVLLVLAAHPQLMSLFGLHAAAQGAFPHF